MSCDLNSKLVKCKKADGHHLKMLYILVNRPISMKFGMHMHIFYSKNCHVTCLNLHNIRT